MHPTSPLLPARRWFDGPPLTVAEPWTGRRVPAWLDEGGVLWTLAGPVAKGVTVEIVSDGPARNTAARLKAGGYRVGGTADDA